MSKVYDIARDRILGRLTAAMETGERFAWVKPWDGGCPWACNYVSEKPYRGVNKIIIPTGEYVTFNQIRELQKKDPDICLKEGSQSYPVFFFRFPEKDPGDGEDGSEDSKRRPVFRYYRVYSVDDVEGVQTRWTYEPVEHALDGDLAAALDAFRSYADRAGVKVESVKGSARAYYSPADHSIRLPDMEQFASSYDYLSTCFHEAVHSTSKELGRNAVGQRSGKAYAAEELVAEMGAAMLCARYLIADDRTEANSVAYLQNWMQHIQGEPGAAVVSAANKAQKACDLISGDYGIALNG